MYHRISFSTCHPPPRDDNRQYIITLTADTPYKNPRTPVSAICIGDNIAVVHQHYNLSDGVIPTKRSAEGSRAGTLPEHSVRFFASL